MSEVRSFCHAATELVLIDCLKKVGGLEEVFIKSGVQRTDWNKVGEQD